MATEPLRMPAFGAGELSALDQLETTPRPARRFPLQVWRGAWPRLAAVVIALAVWQAVVLSGWRPDYLLPGPVPVLRRLAADLTQPVFYGAMAVTLERALWGFGLAIALGSVVGAVVARNRVLRAAIGSLITGLQSMPSIAWFPLAILLFGLTEGAERALMADLVIPERAAEMTGLGSGVGDHGTLRHFYPRQARRLPHRPLHQHGAQ